jgi:hypothetical protein
LGNFWFRVEKNEFFFAYFHVLGHFITKKLDLSEKNFRMSRADAIAVQRKICLTPTAFPLRARKLKFWLPAPHTQNFEIWNLRGTPLR